MLLKTAIKKSLVYAAKYGSVLTVQQLEERLIGPEKWSMAEIEKNARAIGLKSGDGINTTSKEKTAKAVQLSKDVLGKYGDILMVGVTGSVAAGGAKKNEDIDLLIITKNQRLWIVRLLLKIELILKRIPHRKWMREEVGDEYCFNLWLDESNLKIPMAKRNLRNAMDLIMMKVILNRDKTYERFLGVNEWVADYVKTGYFKKVDQKNRMKEKKLGKKSNWLGWVNFFCYVGQRGFMLFKIKKEIISVGTAFFHPDG